MRRSVDAEVVAEARPHGPCGQPVELAFAEFAFRDRVATITQVGAVEARFPLPLAVTDSRVHRVVGRCQSGVALVEVTLADVRERRIDTEARVRRINQAEAAELPR